jgi:putative transposase
LFGQVKARLVHLLKILVAGVYKGTFVEMARTELGVEAELSSRPPAETGFVPIANKWVNEKTFGWFNLFSRRSKGYEHTTKRVEELILIAKCSVVLQRIGCSLNWNRKHALGFILKTDK